MLFALPKDKNGPEEAGSQGKPSIKLAGAIVWQLGVPPLRFAETAVIIHAAHHWKSKLPRHNSENATTKF